MGELHKVIQEVQLNDDSVTDELLIFALPTFEVEQAGWYLGNDDENDETDKILLIEEEDYKRLKTTSDGQLLQCENLVALPKGEEGFHGDSVEFSRDANLWYGSPKTSKQYSETWRLVFVKNTRPK